MDISIRPEDIPLRRDVRTLGFLLGDVLRELGGSELYERVEEARLAAIDRRRGTAGAEERLLETLKGLAPSAGIEVVRAFNAYFDVVNLAERVHRIRRRRDYLREEKPQPGSFDDVLPRLKRAGIDASRLEELLADLDVNPVFTAHPTQATRRTLLVKEQRIAQALIERIEPEGVTPVEDRAALAQIRTEIGVAWQTEQQAAPPSVADELETILFYLTEVVYRVVPVAYQRLERAIASVYRSDSADGIRVPRILRFASWVGGDMDGNPNVGPNTMRDALARQRQLILERYRRELRELFDQMSHSRSRVTVTPEVELQLERYREMLPKRYWEIPQRYHPMPYRMLLWLISARIDATESDTPGRYEAPEQLSADLELIAKSLDGCSGPSTGQHRVRRLLRRVETFGFHLATLDIRQDAAVHRQAIGELLGRADFDELPPAERLALIETAWQEPPATVDPPDGGALDRSLAVMRAIGECRARFGTEAIGPYIISMAQGPDDILAVLLLARTAGLCDSLNGAAGRVPLDVVPLFETVPDLRDAAATLRAMLAHPVYAAHLTERDRRQMIMLGYSDSNKESGLGASRWALFCAQRELIAAAGDISLTFFHGRGGTVSRGGGKPRGGILAEPAGAVRGKLRVTEQGEIISHKYGLRDIAARTLELSLSAVLERNVEAETRDELPAPWLEAATHLAERSRAAYRALVFDDSDFVGYFRGATPIDVIERLRIGSRPASRRSGGGVESLRAIPWVFAWTQSRHLLTGWYGLGSGLQETVERFGAERLAEMLAGWPFIANLLGDAEMVLAKADLSIAARYAELADDTGIFERIRAEFDRTCEAILSLRGTDVLLAGDPVLQRAIRLRNPYIDPMSLLQVDYLRQWRAGGRTDPELERALVATVRGIAQGMQNTG